MTYPDEFMQENVTVGSTATKHPIYTFTVNLGAPTTELIGPITNQRTVTVLSPDQYQSNPDLGRTQAAARVQQMIAWFPGLIPGDNFYINNDGTITAYGAVGTYLKNTYTTGTNPLLTLTNSPPYTSV